jgi:hypothetical protein
MKTDTASWPEALATVTACTYETGALQAVVFGIPTNKHFVIAFNYWANGEIHIGEYTSATAVPQGTLFPITYDPAAPHNHSKSSDTRVTRGPLLAIGIAGSVILTVLWLATMRGCH